VRSGWRHLPGLRRVFPFKLARPDRSPQDPNEEAGRIRPASSPHAPVPGHQAERDSEQRGGVRPSQPEHRRLPDLAPAPPSERRGPQGAAPHRAPGPRPPAADRLCRAARCAALGESRRSSSDALACGADRLRRARHEKPPGCAPPCEPLAGHARGSATSRTSAAFPCAASGLRLGRGGVAGPCGCPSRGGSRTACRPGRGARRPCLSGLCPGPGQRSAGVGTPRPATGMTVRRGALGRCSAQTWERWAVGGPAEVSTGRWHAGRCGVDPAPSGQLAGVPGQSSGRPPESGCPGTGPEEVGRWSSGGVTGRDQVRASVVRADARELVGPPGPPTRVGNVHGRPGSGKRRGSGGAGGVRRSERVGVSSRALQLALWVWAIRRRGIWTARTTARYQGRSTLAGRPSTFVLRTDCQGRSRSASRPALARCSACSPSSLREVLPPGRLSPCPSRYGRARRLLYIGSVVLP